MNGARSPHAVLAAGLIAAALGAAPGARAHESPVDHVARTLRLRVRDGKLVLHYRTELPLRLALLRMRRVDADGDGSVTEKERTRFLQNRARTLADGLVLEVGGERIPFEPAGPPSLAPPYRERFRFAADLAALDAGTHEGELRDRASRAKPGPYTLERPETPETEGPRVRVRQAPRMEKVGRHRAHPAMIALQLKLVLPRGAEDCGDE